MSAPTRRGPFIGVWLPSIVSTPHSEGTEYKPVGGAGPQLLGTEVVVNKQVSELGDHQEMTSATIYGYFGPPSPHFTQPIGTVGP